MKTPGAFATLTRQFFDRFFDLEDLSPQADPQARLAHFHTFYST